MTPSLHMMLLKYIILKVQRYSYTSFPFFLILCLCQGQGMISWIPKFCDKLSRTCLADDIWEKKKITVANSFNTQTYLIFFSVTRKKSSRADGALTCLWEESPPVWPWLWLMVRLFVLHFSMVMREGREALKLSYLFTSNQWLIDAIWLGLLLASKGLDI